jgi:hypothetical protein
MALMGMGRMTLIHRTGTTRRRRPSMSFVLVHVVRRRRTGTSIWPYRPGRRRLTGSSPQRACTRTRRFRAAWRRAPKAIGISQVGVVLLRHSLEGAEDLIAALAILGAAFVCFVVWALFHMRHLLRHTILEAFPLGAGRRVRLRWRATTDYYRTTIGNLRWDDALGPSRGKPAVS